MAFRIDSAGSVTTLPSPASYGTPGYFASPSAAQQTVVSNDWANMCQEEIVAVVLKEGVSLDKTINGQMLAALLAMFAPNPVPLLNAGTSTIIAPSWATRVRVQAWGPGGAGGTGATASAGGGGGGAHCSGVITGITGGANYTYTVGNASGLSGPSAGPTSLVDTSSRVLFQCNQGSNGSSASGSSIGIGGAGGTFVAPSSPYALIGIGIAGIGGQNGIETSSTPSYVVYLGGSGGASFMGDATFNASTGGAVGNFYGGGGGGGAPSNNGGAGAPGAIILNWIP